MPRVYPGAGWTIRSSGVLALSRSSGMMVRSAGDDLRDELAAAAREIQDDSPQEAMQRAVMLATEIIPGCAAAGVCVVYRGDRIDTHATSNDALKEIDALQHELDEGPASTPCARTTRSAATTSRRTTAGPAGVLGSSSAWVSSAA